MNNVDSKAHVEAGYIQTRLLASYRKCPVLTTAVPFMGAFSLVFFAMLIPESRATNVPLSDIAFDTAIIGSIFKFAMAAGIVGALIPAILAFGVKETAYTIGAVPFAIMGILALFLVPIAFFHVLSISLLGAVFGYESYLKFLIEGPADGGFHLGFLRIFAFGIPTVVGLISLGCGSGPKFQKKT